MKKVLIIAYYFPPIAEIGSLRPLGFCRYLERYGWQPRILTTQIDSAYPPLKVDENLCLYLPRRIQIDRVPDGNPLKTISYTRNQMRTTLRGLLRPGDVQLLAGDHSAKLSRARPQGRLSTLKGAVLEHLFLFPDSQAFWLKPAVDKLSQLPASERPDVVFATASPWTSLLVGKALAQRFGVPFIADFRDPWTNNPDDQPLSPHLSVKAKRLERAVCDAAALVVTNTPEVRHVFRTEYPRLAGKFVTITNGFDSETSELAESSCEERGTPQPSPQNAPGLELCHFGSVYGNRTPLTLLQALKELVAENRIQGSELRVRFVGDWLVTDERCEALAHALEVQGVLRREPLVPYKICLRQMALAQVLLILDPARPLQIPGKIYEYIFAGRPLLVIGGEGATGSLVRRHRLGLCCANEVAEIKRILWCMLQGKMSIEPPQAAVRARFDYSKLTGELAAALDSVCREKP